MGANDEETKGDKQVRSQTSLSQMPSLFVMIVMHAAHGEGGEGKRRKERGKKRKRNDGVRSYDGSIQGHPSKKERGGKRRERLKREREKNIYIYIKRKRQRKRREEGEGGQVFPVQAFPVPSYETSVQGHTRKRGVPEC